MNTNRPLKLAEARRRGFYNIGEAASRSGVSAKMIRRYERLGLVQETDRTQAGYRLYSESDIRRFRFIKRARTLDFPMKQVRALLDLWDSPRTSAEVRALFLAQADEMSARIGQLMALEQTLKALACICSGEDDADCPILADLAAVADGSLADGLPARKAGSLRMSKA